jgi:hypothetical protein
MLAWVPLPAYLASTGETREAINKRLARGHWLRGIHARKPDGSADLWVNLQAVNDWAEGRVPAHEHGKRRA